MAVDLTDQARAVLVNLLTDRGRADSFSAAFSRYGQLGMGSLA